MPVEFPALPYDMDALAPHVSARTLEYHYGKHHRGYVDKLNVAIEGTDYEGESLETIVRRSHDNADTSVFNNAAQVWNHTFLWHSMAPDGGGDPDGDLADRIDERFGSIEEFRTQFRRSALSQFGSGWTWLVDTEDGLDIVNTGNAFTPLVDASMPLLTLDVWEHAYYLDYQNGRGNYVDAFLANLINWRFAAGNLVDA